MSYFNKICYYGAGSRRSYACFTVSISTIFLSRPADMSSVGSVGEYAMALTGAVWPLNAPIGCFFV